MSSIQKDLTRQLNLSHIKVVVIGKEYAKQGIGELMEWFKRDPGFPLYLFIPDANFNMLPAFLHYHDPGIAFKDSIMVMSWFAEWVVFLFVAPDLKMDIKMLRKLMVAGIFIFLTVLMGWMLTLLNFGPHLGKELQYPFLEMIRSSSYDDLLGNSDPLLIGLWSSSMFIHSSFLIYVAFRCASFLTKDRGKKYLIPGLTLISLSIAFLYSCNLATYLKHYNSFTIVILWLIVECIPVYYTIIAFFRFRKREGEVTR